MRWRLLISPRMDGPDNMALDEALMMRARRTGEAVVRVYAWSNPTVSFGRNQPAVEAFDAGLIARSGLGVVRRPTGGRALLHHREITYSVTAPVTGTLGAAYSLINSLLVNALGALGVPATIAPRSGRSAPLSGAPCFSEPAAGELAAQGRKLVGSAQWRDDGALLQHGSILVDDDQSTLRELMLGPPPDVPPPATLRGLLGRAPSVDEIAGHLLDAVRLLADRDAERLELEQDVLDDAGRIARHYRDDAWTWRR